MATHPRYPEGSEALLVHHEGEAFRKGDRLLPYDDNTGRPLPPGTTLSGRLTIGVGRNLSDRGVSVEESRYLLGHDLADHWNELIVREPWVEGLDPVRQLAMLDLAFNFGVPRLLRAQSPVLPAVRLFQRHEFDRGSVSLLQSPYAERVGARSRRLAEMFRSGQLPTDVKGLR